MAGAPEHSEAASTASAAEPTAAPSAGAALPRTILERALLRSFADPGPNPTAFGACPGAAYQCNERSHRANSGWFVVFSSDLVISCGEIRAEDGSRAEQAELRFVPCGKGVMDGVPWTWQLTAVRTAGQARLLIQDTASYPSPLVNLLTYHAVVACRDALCTRVANLLAATCEEAADDRSFVGFALDMAFGTLEGRVDLDSEAETDAQDVGKQPQPRWTQPQAQQWSSQPPSWRTEEGEPADGGASAALPSLPQIGEDSATADGAYDHLGAVPELTNYGAARAEVAGKRAAEGGAKPPAAAPAPWQGEPATAELFADFLSYRGPRTDGQQRPDRPAAEVAFQSPREPSGGPVAAQAIYSTADFEDKLDLLRARLPDRSSQELRQLLHQADGEIHAVIAKFQ